MSTPRYMARRRRAMHAAAELLDELDIDQEHPVDVFEAIGRLGLWLVFQRFTTLLGAVVPQGSGGVMITTERNPSIQRYTAAHEIGHWTLDQNGPALDTESDVFHPGAAERERLAQWFASYFLMPPPLVHATVSRHIPASVDISPSSAYLVARDMRVSYEAALHQMTNLELISDHERDQLLAIPPLRAKQQLAYGHRPKVGNADIWLLDPGPAVERLAHEVAVAVDDEIVVALPENRTTGYRWLDDAANTRRTARQTRPAPPAFAAPPSPHTVSPPRQGIPPRTSADVKAALALLQGPQPDQREDQYDDMGLRVVYDQYHPGWARITAPNPAALRRHLAGASNEPTEFLAPATDATPVPPGQDQTARPDPANPGVGATGQRLLALQAHAEGHFTHVLHYAPPHDPRTSPAATFAIEASVTPSPAMLHRRALLDIELDHYTDLPESDTRTGDRRGDGTQQ